MNAKTPSTHSDESGVTVRFVDHIEGYKILDRQARRYFDMSGEEFIRAWNSGELDDRPDQSRVTLVALLIPFAEE